jgi:hypothetical protein
MPTHLASVRVGSRASPLMTRTLCHGVVRPEPNGSLRITGKQRFNDVRNDVLDSRVDPAGNSTVSATCAVNSLQDTDCIEG